MDKHKQPIAERLSGVAEDAMRDAFKDMLDKVRRMAEKGSSSAAFMLTGYSDGQLDTLRKMFEREGFTFRKGYSSDSFTVYW